MSIDEALQALELLQEAAGVEPVGPCREEELNLEALTMARDTIRAALERQCSALEAIAGMEGMTLIAPSAGPDGDQQHQIGANKAFDQAADIAKAALAAAPDPE